AKHLLDDSPDWRTPPKPLKTQNTGAPEGIRTPDLCLRRAALYPAELRARLRVHNAGEAKRQRRGWGPLVVCGLRLRFARRVPEGSGCKRAAVCSRSRAMPSGAATRRWSAR